MIARAREFVVANLAAILGVLLALALAALAYQTVRIDGFGFWPFKVEGLAAKAAQADKFKAERDQARAEVKQSEGLRDQEQGQDRASYSNLSERCDARVSTARDAGRIIGEIAYGNVNREPAEVGQLGNAAGPGVRGIVGADRLRRVIGQDAPSP